ncbi:MAG: tRNA dihydrouridine synthase DusB [Chlamydiae bacterium]|nr:tRNA dihydrouridine synthase DusB [Chlamydiota bacterium]
MYIRPLSLGKLTLRTNIIYSPLAGCSDLPFRRMTIPYRPGLIFCEMVKMDALVRHDKGTYRILDYTKDMSPIGAQLCGSKPNLAAPSAKIIEDLGFDVLDLNCGCPVDKVVKDGSGSGLLKTPEKIGEILSNIVSAVSIPVTVKIRAGWDDENINCEEIVKIAEQAGAKAIFVHGRTREQAYRGPAKWDYVARAKKAAKNILVIGNGDIFTPESAKKIFDETSCDGVLLSRGTLGAPWLAEDVERYLTNQEPIERTDSFILEKLLEHFAFIKEYQEERRAILDMRRVGCWYLKEMPFARSMREKINKAQSLQEVEAVLQESCCY